MVYQGPVKPGTSETTFRETGRSEAAKPTGISIVVKSKGGGGSVEPKKETIVVGGKEVIVGPTQKAETKQLTAQDRINRQLLGKAISQASLEKARSGAGQTLNQAEIQKVAQEFYGGKATPADYVMKEGQGYSVALENQKAFLEKKLASNKNIIEKIQDKVNQGTATYGEERVLQAKTRENENLLDKARRISPEVAGGLASARSLVGSGGGIIKTFTKYGPLAPLVIAKDTAGGTLRLLKTGLPEVGQTLRTNPRFATGYVAAEVGTGFLGGAALSKLTKGSKVALTAEDIASTVKITGNSRQKLINKAAELGTFGEDLAKAAGTKDSSLLTYRITTKAGDKIDVIQISKSLEKVEDLNGVTRYQPNQADTVVYAIKQEGKGISSLVGSVKSRTIGDEFFSKGQFVKLEPQFFKDKATKVATLEKGKVIQASPTGTPGRKFIVESEAVIESINDLKGKAAKKLNEIRDLARNGNIPRNEKLLAIKDLTRELTDIEGGILKKLDAKNFEKLGQAGIIKSRTAINDVLKEIRRTKSQYGSGIKIQIKKGDIRINKFKEIKGRFLNMGETRSNILGIGKTSLVKPKPLIQRVRKPVTFKDMLSKAPEKKVVNNQVNIKSSPQIAKVKLKSKAVTNKVNLASRPVSSQITAAFSNKAVETGVFVPKSRTFSLAKSIQSPIESTTTISAEGVKPITKTSLTTSTAEGEGSKVNLGIKQPQLIGFGNKDKSIERTKLDTGLKIREGQEQLPKFKQDFKFKQEYKTKQDYRFRQRLKTPEPIRPFRLKLPNVNTVKEASKIKRTPLSSRRGKLIKVRLKVKTKFEKNVKLRSETAAKSPLNVVVGREFNPVRLKRLRASLTKRFQRKVTAVKGLKKTGFIKSYKIFRRRK